MAERTETNYLDAKSSKKYAVLKKTALKTDSGRWSDAWSKKKVEDVPNSDVADINLTN